MTEETGRSLFPERSIYEHQLNDPNFQGFGGRQSPFGKRPHGPKRSTRPSVTPSSRTSLNLAWTLIFVGACTYVVPPPINLQAEEFYLFMLPVASGTRAAPRADFGFQAAGHGLPFVS